VSLTLTEMCTMEIIIL